jgi:hypothetical protein
MGKEVRHSHNTKHSGVLVFNQQMVGGKRMAYSFSFVLRFLREIALNVYGYSRQYILRIISSANHFVHSLCALFLRLLWSYLKARSVLADWQSARRAFSIIEQCQFIIPLVSVISSNTSDIILLQSSGENQTEFISWQISIGAIFLG